MDKADFVTVIVSFGKLDVCKKTFSSVIDETKKHGNSKVIIIDTTDKKNGRNEKWDYLRSNCEGEDVFVITSSNMSLGHCRNLGLSLSKSLYAPDYICMIDDDHGFKEGMIDNSIEAMDKYYGKECENGFLYGMFSCCGDHLPGDNRKVGDNHLYPHKSNSIGVLGGVNNCCRMAPTQHWDSVLKTYETDEYLISFRQSTKMNRRNYHKGFTTMVISSGDYMFSIDTTGRGNSIDGKWMFDKKYAASDYRSDFRGKGTGENTL